MEIDPWWFRKWELEDREAQKKRLAALEAEVQRLQRLDQWISEEEKPILRSAKGRHLLRSDHGHFDSKNQRAAKRRQLLAEYRADVGPISDRAIYTARNHPVCKPEWINWKNGTLPDDSISSENIARFLRTRQKPVS